MYRLYRMIQRDFLNLLFNPTWFFFCIMFPFLLVAIIGFMTKGMYNENFTSYDYYGVSLMIYSALYSGTFSANSFMEERIKRANMRSVYAPIGQGIIPLSKNIANSFYTLVFFSIVAVLNGLLFKVNYGSNIFLLWLLFAGVNFVSSSLGIFMCCLFKTEGTTNQILSIITNIVAIMGGLLFPAASMGVAFNQLSQHTPLAKVTQVAFELIYDNSSPTFIITMISIIMISITLILAANLLFRGEDYVQ